MFLLMLTGSMSLFLMDLLRKPKFLFYAIRKGLKKHGFKGHIRYGDATWG